MKSIWVLSLVLLLTACGDERLYSTICEAPCYSGPHNTLGVGTCKAGRPKCDENHKLIACENETLPKTRTCTTTEDVSCDYFKSLPTDKGLNESCGVNMPNSPCHPGTLQCINHQLICKDQGLPEPESCSPIGYDHNCDGIPNNIKPTVCYDGNPMDLIVPNTTCKAGITECSMGQEICYGEIYPMNDGRNIDIIVIANSDNDFANTFIPLKTSLISFAQINNSSYFKYGFIEFPGTATIADHLYHLDLDMSPAQVFTSTLPHLITGIGNNNGSEYPYDALYAVATDSIGLHLRNDSKKFVILFVDDNDCGTTCFPGNKDLMSVLIALQQTNISVIVFADPNYWNDWVEIVTKTHGGLYDINQKPDQILELLIMMFGTQCI